jgi:hypothetical protein
MREGAYQKQLIDKITALFPDCLIVKNDPGYKQGIPDLLILFGNKWAMLEVKTSATSSIQPNQQFYVEKLDGMSFAAIVHPDNEEMVLDALQSTFGSGG